MGWLGRTSLAFAVLGAGLGGWWAGNSAIRDLSGREEISSEREAPYRVSLRGNALTARILEDLAAVNVTRSESRSRTPLRSVLLIKSSFERSAGGVVARGVMSDPVGPRPLFVVVDAFGDEGRYISSSASLVQSSPGPTHFSASLPDRDEFETFAVRFLDAGGKEIRMSTPSDPVPGVPPLLADDAVWSADLGEVAERLAALGYVEDPGRASSDLTAFATVRRFRKDHGLAGPGWVTLSDLLALRAVTPSERVVRPIDLNRY